MPPLISDRFQLEVRLGRDRDIEEWLGTDTTLDRPVLVRLIGPDAETLYEKGNRLVDGLRAMPGTLNVRSDWENQKLRARILVDQVRARRAGVTSRDIALSLKSNMDGLEVDPSQVETNIVYIRLTGAGPGAPEWVDELRGEGVLVVLTGPREFRAVTHLDVDDEGIRRAVDGFARVSKTLSPRS